MLLSLVRSRGYSLLNAECTKYAICADSISAQFEENYMYHRYDASFCLRHLISVICSHVIQCTNKSLLVCVLLSGELLAEHCHTDNLVSNISISCLPPCRVDPQSSETGHHHLFSARWFLGVKPLRWWSRCGGDDTVVVFLWDRASQVSAAMLYSYSLTSAPCRLTV